MFGKPNKKPFYVYGQSPNPTSWHDTADILKQSSKPAKKPSKSDGHLEAIEKLLKASK